MLVAATVFQTIAEHGRMEWQKRSGYNWRAFELQQ